MTCLWSASLFRMTAQVYKAVPTPPRFKNFCVFTTTIFNPKWGEDDMKHCGHCDIDVDNSFNLCPYCGQTLELKNSVASSMRYHSSNTEQNTGTKGEHTSEGYSGAETSASQSQDETSPFSMQFEAVERGKIVLNGKVVESNLQQYYQARFTKIFQSVFHGEPYQFGHTTFVTVFRVEEHRQYGFAERSRDIVVYGQLQNTLVPGDDVTVVAAPKGSRLIAKSIVNHSSEAQIIPSGGMISAAVARTAILVPLIVVVAVLAKVMTTPPNIVAGTFINLFWPIILVGIGIAWIKKRFRKK